MGTLEDKEQIGGDRCVPDSGMRYAVATRSAISLT